MQLDAIVARYHSQLCEYKAVSTIILPGCGCHLLESCCRGILATALWSKLPCTCQCWKVLAVKAVCKTANINMRLMDLLEENKNRENTSVASVQQALRRQTGLGGVAGEYRCELHNNEIAPLHRQLTCSNHFAMTCRLASNRATLLL